MSASVSARSWWFCLPQSPTCAAAAGESVDSLELTKPHERLRELGLELPAPPAAVASYVPTRLVPIGDGRPLLYVAGQAAAANRQRLTRRCPDRGSRQPAQPSGRGC